ncbi:MAG: FecR family protein [Mediterranea sp.]|jgi:ferric-dicitrate binding protein FerR (iron transport regulator)|nr:FecR family protein [Mediterranea sp.]
MKRLDKKWIIFADHFSRGKDDCDEDKLLLGLDDEDRLLFDVLESVRLDCDYEQANKRKPEIEESMYRKMFDPKQVKAKGKRNPYIFLLAVAACLVVAISMYYVYLYRRDVQTDGNTLIAFSVSNGVSSVVLPDSSVVTLNAGSTFSYAKDYNRTIRKVYLDGEACFDVRPDKNKAFIVSLDKIDVKVLGTVFNVRAYPEDGEVVTSLVSGSVRIEDKESEMICQLSPNQAAIYEKETSQMQIETCDFKYAIGWMSGEVLFKRKSFPEICKILSRKFNYSIDIKNEAIKKKVFTGKFINNEPLSEILDIMRINFPFTYIVEGDCVTIY